MKHKYIVALVLGLTVCLLILVVVDRDEPVVETTTVTTSELPSGTPGNSAPSFALAACKDKQFGEACELTNGTTTIEGICYQSADQLACGLSLPTETNL